MHFGEIDVDNIYCLLEIQFKWTVWNFILIWEITFEPTAGNNEGITDIIEMEI